MAAVQCTQNRKPFFRKAGLGKGLFEQGTCGRGASARGIACTQHFAKCKFSEMQGSQNRLVETRQPAVENPKQALITAFYKNAAPCKSYTNCNGTQPSRKRKLCENVGVPPLDRKIEPIYKSGV